MSSPPTRVAGPGRGWYRGDCHVHSVRSHARGSDACAAGRGGAGLGLDFIAVTEHNTPVAPGTWAAAAGNDLLVVLGRGLAAGVHRGRWQPAIGNSDAHLAGQLGRPHSVVLADELSTAAVLAGLRSGRSWLADSTAVELSFEVVAGDRSAGIGEGVRARGEPVLARVEVRGVPSGTVSFHTERGVVRRHSLPAAGSGATEWRFSGEDTGFVRVEMRYDDGSMAAITNPVLVSL